MAKELKKKTAEWYVNQFAGWKWLYGILSLPALFTAPSQLLLVFLRPVKPCKALEEFPFRSQRNTELYWVFNINFILLEFFKK